MNKVYIVARYAEELEVERIFRTLEGAKRWAEAHSRGLEPNGWEEEAYGGAYSRHWSPRPIGGKHYGTELYEIYEIDVED